MPESNQRVYHQLRQQLDDQLKDLNCDEKKVKMQKLKKKFCLVKSGVVVIISLLVTFIGSIVFMGIEGKNEKLKNYQLLEEQLLFNKTYKSKLRDFDKFYRTAVNISDLKCKIAVYDLNSWNNATFIDKITYSTSIVSTVGWGVHYPLSVTARIVTIIYALIGIPIYLSYIGQLVRMITKVEVKLLTSPRLKHFIRNQSVLQLLLVVILYLAILLEGLIFVALHNSLLHDHKLTSKLEAAGSNDASWNLLSGVYFQFTTVSTIGFGDVYIYDGNHGVIKGLLKNVIFSIIITTVLALYTRLFDNFSQLILKGFEKKIVELYLKENVETDL